MFLPKTSFDKLPIMMKVNENYYEWFSPAMRLCAVFVWENFTNTKPKTTLLVTFAFCGTSWNRLNIYSLCFSFDLGFVYPAPIVVGVVGMGHVKGMVDMWDKPVSKEHLLEITR